MISALHNKQFNQFDTSNVWVFRRKKTETERIYRLANYRKLQENANSYFSAAPTDDEVRHKTLAYDVQDNSPLCETRQLPVASLRSCDLGPLLPQLNKVTDQEQKEGMYQRSCNKSVDNWIQCDGCGSWRLLPDFVSLSSLPEEW